MKKIINLTLLLAAGLILGSNLNSVDRLFELELRAREIFLTREKRTAVAKFNREDATYMREMSQDQIADVEERIEACSDEIYRLVKLLDEVEKDMHIRGMKPVVPGY